MDWKYVIRVYTAAGLLDSFYFLTIIMRRRCCCCALNWLKKKKLECMSTKNVVSIDLIHSYKDDLFWKYWHYWELEHCFPDIWNPLASCMLLIHSEFNVSGTILQYLIKTVGDCSAWSRTFQSQDFCDLLLLLFWLIYSLIMAIQSPFNTHWQANV
jgi:hypothetical protein